jgi:hypothetical protein
MKRIGIVAALIAVVLVGHGAPARATAVRTFVSGHGTDSGTCGVGAPCRTFAFALTQTSAGGEIVVLDSAGYGVVTIAQAVSITNEQGVEAAVTVGSGAGITVSAGGGDTVNLSGLTLIGGGGANGILVNSAGTVIIQNCVTHGFTQSGISAAPTADLTLDVFNSVSSNNGIGFNITPPSGTPAVHATFQGVQALSNGLDGLTVDSSLMAGGFIQLVLVNSTASGNAQNGLNAISAGGTGSTSVWSLGSTLSFNFSGLTETGVNTNAFIGSSRIMGNIEFGFSLSNSATLKSWGNNLISDLNEQGSSSAIALQ